jgi:acyl-CoA reductase-like NAD-dependent aldehyde dehydrogenase
LRHNAGLALAQRGGASEILPGVFGVSTHEPIGVAGLIIPWNAPLALCVRALGPALAAGCTVVIKMPAQTALTNALIAEALASARSLPPGVVNLITESGNDCAMLLVESPLVDAINFTGSTRTGKQIAAKAAESLKRVSLELGGKTPLVVFEDTDIDAVAPVVVAAITMFSGQFCMAGSRVLVQRSVADAWRTRLAAMLEAVVLGPADDPSSQMGPLIDKDNVARVDAFVRDAAAYGSVLVRGGPVVEGALAEGSFFRPAMIEPSHVGVPLVQQEIFGPVLSFETFEDEADAVRLANATDYGLAASVFTRDLDRAQRVVRAIKAGTVWVNGWATLSDSYEEGGFKQSGVGRARGSASLEEFQETKTTIQVVASPQRAGSGAGH